MGFIYFFVLVAILGICRWLYHLQKNDKIPEQQYRHYWHSHEGKSCFCYTNRGNSQKYLEEFIIPYLPKNMSIVFLRGKKIESMFSHEYISQALYKLKDKKGFPFLLKVRDGKIIDLSIKEELYRVINQNKDPKSLIETIYLFYIN